MDNSNHFLLGGEGARRFAKDRGVPLVPLNFLLAQHAQQDLEEYKTLIARDYRFVEMASGCGGVGAVAVDGKGRLAAASSTGGRLGKLPGRTSDASIVGAGIYADDEIGAVVVTGYFEMWKILPYKRIGVRGQRKLPLHTSKF